MVTLATHYLALRATHSATHSATHYLALRATHSATHYLALRATHSATHLALGLGRGVDEGELHCIVKYMLPI